MTFGVITKIEGRSDACCAILVDPQGDSVVVGSNLVVDPDIDEDEYPGLFAEALTSQQTTIDLTKKQLLMGNAPVFRLGEILVMDGNGRTIPDGRKPSKWFVTCEYFENIEDAKKRSKEVYEQK